MRRRRLRVVRRCGVLCVACAAVNLAATVAPVARHIHFPPEDPGREAEEMSDEDWNYLLCDATGSRHPG